MSRARDRASREGTSPVKIGTTQLNTDSGDLKITDTSNNLKKVVADEIHIGDDSNKVIIKKGSDNKVQFQTQASGQAATDSSTGGVTVYANVSAMSAASADAGDLAFVTATKKLYVHNGGGWYAFTSEVNTTPVISSPATGLSYKLASDGTATSLEITATDAEVGTTLQYSYAVTTGSLGSTATVTSSATSGGTYSALAASTNTTNRFFKINPSTNSAHAGSFTLTFSVTDSLNAATTAQTFTLSFDVSGSVFFYGGNDVISAAGHGIISPVSNDLVIGTNDFTIEYWAWSDNFNAAQTISDRRSGHSSDLMIGINGSGQHRLYANSSYRILSDAVNARTWNHVAVQRASNVTKMYLNGIEQSTTYSDTNNYTGNKVVLGVENNLNSSGLYGYISNYREVIGSNAYSPASPSNYYGSFTGGPVYKINSADIIGSGGTYTTAGQGLNLGTGAWTIEAWINTSSTSWSLIDFGLSNGNHDQFVTDNGNSYAFYTDGSAWNSLNWWSSSDNGVWNHIAYVKESATLAKIYKNGVLRETITTGSSTHYGYDENDIHIGRRSDGYYRDTGMKLSNLRIVKGTAVYTGAFSPPTSPLTAISGTSLLAFQQHSGSPADRSGNSVPLTAVEAGTASTDTPFVPTFDVPTRQLTAITNTKLLTLQGITPKYETGGAAYMTSRYGGIKVDDAVFEVGTGDFTVEFYYRFVSHGSGSYYLMFKYNDFQFGYATSNTNLGMYYGGWTQASPTGVGLDLHRWYHCAMVRTGGNVKVYIDGVEILSTTSGATANISVGEFYLNGQYAASGYGMHGGIYYSQVRFCSKAVYTGAFTPPRNISKTGGNYESTTNVSNPTAAQTELLTLMRSHYTGDPVDESDNSLTLTVTGSVIANQTSVQSPSLKDNSSLNHTLTQSGMPKGSYVTPFNQGSGSIECDDYTNRYIYVDDSDIQLGSGDFCIEYWFMDKGMYGLAQTYNETYEYNGHWSFSSSSYVPFPSSGGTSAANGFTMYHQKGSTTPSGGAFYVSNITTGSSFYVTSGNAVINPLTWYHFALVRESNEIKLYFNGTRMPFGSTFTNSTNITYNRLAIGGGYAQYAVLTGHISNFRLVVGSPVYTGNFTPPTSALTAITNTKLLTAQDSHQIVDASGNCTIIPVNGCAATRLSPF